MIRNLSEINLDTIDYQVTDISKYKQVERCKILILDDESYDSTEIRELFVSSPKIKLILVTDKSCVEFYEAGIDYVVTPSEADKKINGIIRNLDIRHKVISRVQIKEDFNKINVNGVDIRLTPKEMIIYTYLNDNRGNLCKRKTMLTEVLGYHEDADSRVIDVYVKHLRTKLREEGYKIETIRGKGYIYNY